MCKVLMIAGIKKEKASLVWKFAKAMAVEMSYANRDGLGYAAITAKGELFGERWMQNSAAFSNDSNVPVASVNDDMRDVLLINDTTTYPERPKDGEFNTFGEKDIENMVALTLHTRMATTPKVMANTHPFVDGNTSLIHNGVIRNYTEFELRQSSCDSEVLLNQYQDYKISEDVSGFQDAMTDVKGYYACGVLTVDATKTPVLDVFKSIQSNLHAAYVKELECWVWTTTEQDITDACRKLGLTNQKGYIVRSEKLIRMNAITGAKISVTDFKEAGSGWEHNTAHTTTKYPNIIDATKSESHKKSNVVVGMTKKEKNTKVSEDFLGYFKTTPVACRELSKREVLQEDEARAGFLEYINKGFIS